MKMTVRNVRLSFVALLEPKAVNAGDKPAYSASLLLAPTDPQVAAINAAMLEAAKAKWGAKGETMFKTLKAGDKLALHNGDSKAQYAGFEGNMFISARNQAKPALKHRDGRTDVTEAGVLYSGCYANAVLELWAQDNNYGKRINATLLGVQFVKDGESFGGGGGRASDEDFDELSMDEGDDLM